VNLKFALVMLSWYEVAVHLGAIRICLPCFFFRSLTSVSIVEFEVKVTRVNVSVSHNKKVEKDVRENPSDCASNEFCTFC